MSPKTGADDLVRDGATAADFEALPREDLASKDDEPKKPSQSQTLVDLAREAGAELFHAPDGDTGYAVIPVAGHFETWAIRSKGFRRWLARLYFGTIEKPPSAQPMADALNLLEALAQYEGREAPVYVRVGRDGEAIYLDLANGKWEAVEVTAAGWRVVGDPPVRFRRPRGMVPLPTPKRSGRLDDLRSFLNLGGHADWMLAVAWLLAALRPTGPYPVLVLHGEQGSAKSTLARVLRSLVDPNTAPLRGNPLDQRDLMIAATNGWVLSYDNLSHVPAWLSDVFCRLATGGGFSTRELYSDQDEVLFEAQRPVILNGIEELVTRGDLLDRALMLYLPAIPESGRRDERRFWRDFETARPRLLGALLDAVAVALQRLAEVQLDRRPRLADFAEWIAAAEPALAWPPGAFLRAYCDNRTVAVDLALDASSVAPLVRDLADRAPWTGTAGELLAILTDATPETTRRLRSWPGSPQALGNALRRLVPALRAAGVEVTFLDREAGRRPLRVEKVTPEGRHSRQGRHDPAAGAGFAHDDPGDDMTMPSVGSSSQKPAPDRANDDCDDHDDSPTLLSQGRERVRL